LASAIVTEDIRQVRLGKVWQSQALGVGLVPAPLSGLRRSLPGLPAPPSPLGLPRHQGPPQGRL